MNYKILIINRGLSALKFIISIKDKYPNLFICGFITENDIISKYKYLELVDELIEAPNDIYMDKEKIINICKANNIFAVFPGWGYLSEDSSFVELLENNNITFMGPSSHVINTLGNKIQSMLIAEKTQVPLVKWSGGNTLKTLEEVKKFVYDIKVPCVLKDADGGGGKGIRIINNYDEIEHKFNQINTEMKRSEGNIFVMDLMKNCHHIEIQLLGDGENVIHLFGRDCTTQRRNQKLIEEGPITVLPENILHQIENSAVKMAKEVKYKGLGTAEFLYDGNKITFLEINPRLQVEHIVTELLLDLNLPVLLYEVTCLNKKLNDIFTKKLIRPKKHVLAVRINAEEPLKNFQPSIGVVKNINIPNILHSWHYSSLHNNGQIINDVDSQIGHLFTIGNSREEAINKMKSLIHLVEINGIHTGIDFTKNILNTSEFVNNTHYTNWVDYKMFYNNDNDYIIGLINQGYYKYKENKIYIDSLNKNGHNLHVGNIIDVGVSINNKIIDGKVHIFEIDKYKNDDYGIENININNELYDIWLEIDNKFIFKQIKIISDNILLYDGLLCKFYNYSNNYDNFKIKYNNNIFYYNEIIDLTKIVAPFNGNIIKVNKNGYYKKNEVIIELEAMKIITELRTNIDGYINFNCKEGTYISKGTILGIVETDDKPIKLKIDINNIKTYDNIIYKDIYKNNSISKQNISTNYNLLNILQSFEITYIERINDNKIFKNVDDKIYSDINCGIISFNINNKFILITHHNTNNNCSFGLEEQDMFLHSSKLAREKNIPRFYISKTSGAQLNYNKDLIKYLTLINDKVYIKENDYENNKESIIINHNIEILNDIKYYNVIKLKNPSIEILDGCSKIASETALAYNNIPTFTYVVGYSVGIGAYLARLGHRIIQRKDSAMLLTGYNALNKLLGNNLYTSNNQLGGIDVMFNNGITHQIVDNDIQAGMLFNNWINIYYSIPPTIDYYGWSKVPYELTNIIDNNLWMETMKNYGKSVMSGRGYIDGNSLAIIYANSLISEKIIPIDPGDLNTKKNIQQQSGNVLYPDTSYKFSQTLSDANNEKLNCLIIINWRGFSGGTRDMFDHILTYGSKILDNLRTYKQKIFCYIPEGAQLRGGAMVVMSSGVNKKNIVIYAHENSRIGILEPNGTYQVKFKKHYTNIDEKNIIKMIDMYDYPYNDIIKICNKNNLKNKIIEYFK